MTSLLDHTDDARLAASRDFGRMARRVPRVVARPRTAREVRRVLQYAERHDLTVRVRGRGHSVDGQTLVADGLVLDPVRLNAVTVAPDRASVSAGAGATWRQVVTAALAAGRVPPVVVDFLDLTVGGTITVGGISGTSHRYGMQADTLSALDVVTTRGLLRCSPAGHGNPPFGGSAGPGGRGVIVAATIRLVPAPRHVAHLTATSTDLGELLDLQTRGLRRRAHVAGWACFDPDGVLNFTAEIAMDWQRSRWDPFFAGVVGARTSSVVRRPLRDFLARADRIVERQRVDGSWEGSQHPRATFLLPFDRGATLAADLLADLTPAELGPGAVLIYPTHTARMRARHVPADREGRALVLGFQRTAAGPDDIRRMRAANTTVARRVREAGGVPYGGAAPPTAASRGSTPREHDRPTRRHHRSAPRRCEED